MATYQINMADEKLIGQIADPEAITKAAPRLSSFFEGVKDMRNMLVSEPGGKGTFTRTSGWFKGSKKMQYVGTVPVSLVAAVREIDPGFWEDVKKVERFFLLHPEYVVKSVVP